MSQPGRLLAAMLGLLALMATACGGYGGGGGGAATEEAAGPTRSVQHAMGSTEVSGSPQRVVVLDTGELDSVLALGVKPVGAVRADEATGPQAYLADRAKGIEPVGTVGQPNLEAIAALQPDLILSNKVRHEEIYDKLSGIAPTVFAESVGEPWKQNFRLAGEALGKSDQAERILADYRRKAEQVGRRFGDPARVEVSMVRFMSDGVRLYGEGSFIGTILADAGFARPQIARTTPAGASPAQVSAPASLHIPAIEVSSPLNSVGLNPDRTMQVPAPGPRYDQAAWYRFSPMPGELGPSVIIGHVDSAAGGPSVFYQLGALKPGERIEVTRVDRSTATFAVDAVRSYPKDAFPQQTVYGDTTSPELRLITCGGNFDASTRSYRDNTVVFASQVS